MSVSQECISCIFLQEIVYDQKLEVMSPLGNHDCFSTANSAVVTSEFFICRTDTVHVNFVHVQYKRPNIIHIVCDGQYICSLKVKLIAYETHPTVT